MGFDENAAKFRSLVDVKFQVSAQRDLAGYGNEKEACHLAVRRCWKHSTPM
jgi:hypothetical protein